MTHYDFDKVDSFVGDTSEKRRVQKLLSKGVYSVTWNSQAGVKTMEVTLSDKHIPGTALLTESDLLLNQTQKGAETVRAYSLDRQGWRSFNVNKIVTMTKVSTN